MNTNPKLENLLAPDTVIGGRYLVVSVLGAGRTGIVYEVADEQLGGERIALKLLYPHLLENETAVKRARQEVFLVRQLNHPNIIRLYEIELGDSDTQFVTMELVEGFSLRYMMDHLGRSFQDQEVRSIISQLLIALQVAHQKGVVHRDIKPENILIDYNGILKLGDFGCFQDTESERLTRTGQLIGTPAYMAPEQFRSDAVSPSTDMYSVGILAYELMCGHVPFKDTALYELAQSHATKAPKLDVLPRDFSKTLRVFVDKSLLKLADQRVTDAVSGLKLLEVDDAEKQAKVLEGLITEHFLDTRESKSSRRRSAISHGILITFAVFCALLLATSHKFIVTIQADLLRIERYFDINAPVLRRILRLPQLTLKDPRTIHYAIESGNEREVHTWCTAGIMSNERNESGKSLIHTFIENPRMMISALDFDPGCIDPFIFDQVSKGEERPVVAAVKSGHVGGLQTLIELNFNPNVKDADGKTALELAIDSGNPRLVHALSKRRTHSLMLDYPGRESALSKAIRSGNIDMLKTVLSLGVNILQRDVSGRNCLMQAATSPKRQRTKIMSLLLSRGAQCNAYDNRGKHLREYFEEDSKERRLIDSCLEKQATHGESDS